MVPSRASALVAIAWLLHVQGGQVPTTAPSLAPSFRMNVICKSWVDESSVSCTIAYIHDGNGLGNRLFLSCSSRGVSHTKLYDFSNDMLVTYKVGTGERSWTNGIPELENDDPCFALKFRAEGKKKIFDGPESLFHFNGDGKKLAEGSPVQANEWEADSIVTAQGAMYQCITNVGFTRNSALPHCGTKSADGVHCPLVPLVASVLCGNDKIIRYSFSDYTEEYDRSVFEYKEPLLSSKDPTSEVRLSRDIATQAAPSLSSNFTLNVLCKTWTDNLRDCRLAYTRGDHDMQNRLYVSCLFQGVNYTKIYDFNQNILVTYDGSANKWSYKKGIPESEKYDPCFPVKFRNEGDVKVFDQPESLFHLDGANTVPSPGAAARHGEWKVHTHVTVQGKDFECTNNIVFAKNSAVSSSCEGEFLDKAVCRPVPLVAEVVCEEDYHIHYSFRGYEQVYDDSVFEVPKELWHIILGRQPLSSNARED